MSCVFCCLASLQVPVLPIHIVGLSRRIRDVHVFCEFTFWAIPTSPYPVWAANQYFVVWSLECDFTSDLPYNLGQDLTVQILNILGIAPIPILDTQHRIYASHWVEKSSTWAALSSLAFRAALVLLLMMLGLLHALQPAEHVASPKPLRDTSYVQLENAHDQMSKWWTFEMSRWASTGACRLRWNMSYLADTTIEPSWTKIEVYRLEWNLTWSGKNCRPNQDDPPSREKFSASSISIRRSPHVVRAYLSCISVMCNR